jgi:hypothetical protein
VAVSPGDAAKVAQVEDRCPTFSWGEVKGATSYELVVYRLGEQGEESQPVLRQGFAGSVDGWTPALDQCLERGGRYAWSVRAIGMKEAEEWSSPNLFEVASGPSDAEFQAALAIVRTYSEGQGRAVYPPPSAVVKGTEAVPSDRKVAESAASPVAVAPAPTQLSIDGNVDAISFTGDGSNLTGVALGSEVADLQARFDCPSAAFSAGGRFVDCGNGTIRDMNTGLIWLKDASCADMPETDASGLAADWDGAKAAAAALKDGICGLADGSVPGQWRLPEIGEFCSEDSPTPTAGECPAASATDSLLNTNFSPFALSNAAGLGGWTTDGDAFVGVQTLPSAIIWSATEMVDPFAWAVSFATGSVDFHPKGTGGFVWPVRGGQ